MVNEAIPHTLQDFLKDLLLMLALVSDRLPPLYTFKRSCRGHLLRGQSFGGTKGKKTQYYVDIDFNVMAVWSMFICSCKHTVKEF